ncbi:IclR family transcriptional regulator [Rubrivivax sp. A210]|uniref:IclR family transcriptional regulator domain-containing protein n=1 Tax=Rubrivivax sp. A210 TaxID=2772301 RepID=UPI00191B1BBC|nr:IclR family transcriptional regulator C-terminal domain-containing protein [Rubrivivax sp. A210]CAD5375130.1 IclR family transcriptional regulator [Rubrivivax sp. A210]
MTTAPFPIERKDLIEGFGKGLKVIEAFDHDHARLTPSETAERAGITRTAARRYLLSLAHFGFADSDGKHFWLTPRVLRLGQSYLESARLPRLVQPFIQRISMQCGETINASVLDGHEIVYVARSNPPRLVSIGYQVAARVPAHVVSPGTVILSTFTEDALAEWIAAHDFSSFTSHTITDRAKFHERVRAARALGHWISDQQLDMGLRGIAVPLIDRHGACRGAIGTTIPSQAYSVEDLVAKLLPLLREAAQALRPLI